MAKLGLDEGNKANQSPYSNIVSAKQESKLRVMEDSASNVFAEDGVSNPASGDLILCGGIFRSSAKLLETQLTYGGATAPDLVELKSDESEVVIAAAHNIAGVAVAQFPSVEIAEGSRLALRTNASEAVGATDFRAKYTSNNE